jgi:hypothetical protein
MATTRRVKGRASARTVQAQQCVTTAIHADQQREFALFNRIAQLRVQSGSTQKRTQQLKAAVKAALFPEGVEDAGRSLPKCRKEQHFFPKRPIVNVCSHWSWTVNFIIHELSEGPEVSEEHPAPWGGTDVHKKSPPRAVDGRYSTMLAGHLGGGLMLRLQCMRVNLTEETTKGSTRKMSMSMTVNATMNAQRYFAPADSYWGVSVVCRILYLMSI